jgi:hypothetical protein
MYGTFRELCQFRSYCILISLYYLETNFRQTSTNLQGLFDHKSKGRFILFTLRHSCDSSHLVKTCALGTLNLRGKIKSEKTCLMLHITYMFLNCAYIYIFLLITYLLYALSCRFLKLGATMRSIRL